MLATILFCVLPYVENKIGFIFLQSCDRCSSHSKILGVGQQLLLQAATILSEYQAPPSVPPNPQEYVGVYTASVKGGLT